MRAHSSKSPGAPICALGHEYVRVSVIEDDTKDLHLCIDGRASSEHFCPRPELRLALGAVLRLCEVSPHVFCVEEHGEGDRNSTEQECLATVQNELGGAAMDSLW